MFTGIIQAVGRVERIEPRGGDLRLHVSADGIAWDEVQLGDSIAVAGACLTAVERTAHGFGADVSTETLACTTLGALALRDPVNLELALRAMDRLGGHLVSGHVDGVGHVVSRSADARSERWVIELPHALARYVAAKGSVCVDGVSLTVNAVDGDRFGVNLIPHTIAHTTFHARRAGSAVNIEVDVVARYVERLLAPDGAPRLDAAFLARHGFA